MSNDLKAKKLDGDLSMKLIHVISGDLWAGAEVQVFQTLSAVKKNIDLTCLVFNEGVLLEKLVKEDIKTILLDENKNSSFKLIKLLQEILFNFKPDIIHVHAVKEHYIAKLSCLFFNKKISVFRTVHGARNVPPGLPLIKFFRSKFVVGLDNFLIRRCTDVVIAVSKDLKKEF